MPTRLNTIYQSLFQAITEYCEIQPSAAVLETENAVESGYELDWHLDLKELIASTLSARQSSIDRVPLMNYLFFLMQKIKPLAEENVILDEAATSHLNQELTHFFLNIQRVLLTPQTKQINVDYNGNSHAIFGCHRGLVGLSKSGRIIERLLFEGLNLSIQSNEASIASFISSAMNAHQCPLLRKENKRLQELVIHLRLQPLLNTSHIPTPEILRAQEEIEDLREQLEAATQALQQTHQPAAKAVAIASKRPVGSALFSFGFNQFAPFMATIGKSNLPPQTFDPDIDSHHYADYRF